MGLNSEPLPEDIDLLRMIDRGIASLSGDGEEGFALDAQQLMRRKEEKEA